MVHRDIRMQYLWQNDNRYYCKSKHFSTFYHLLYGTMCLYQKRMARYEHMHYILTKINYNQ